MCSEPSSSACLTKACPSAVSTRHRSDRVYPPTLRRSQARGCAPTAALTSSRSGCDITLSYTDAEHLGRRAAAQYLGPGGRGVSELGRIVAVLLLVLGNAIFVAAEYALVTARRSRLEPRAEDGSRAATTALRDRKS